MVSKVLGLFGSLLSGSKPWQISLAIAFGLVIGLTPLWSLHNVVLFVLAFIINLHFGTMLLSISIFFGISFALDPMFHSIGEAILTFGALEGLWTGLFNIELIRATRFYNTIVMGSLAVSLVAVVPLLLLGTKVIEKLRGLFQALGNIPVVKFFLSMEEDGDAPIFRWQGVLILLIVGGGTAFFTLVVMDPMLKMVLENTASDAVGAPVTVNSLATKIPSGIKIEKVQVTDKKNPSRNKIEADTLALSIRPWQLFEKKMIVEELRMEGIRWGAKREGEVGKKPGWGKINVNASMPDVGSFKFKSPQDILEIESLKSLVYLKTSIAKLRMIQAKWKKHIADLKSTYNTRKETLQSLKNKSQNLKTPQQVADFVIESNKFRKDVTDDINHINRLQNELKQDMKLVEEVSKGYQDLVNKDLEYLKKKYSTAGQGFDLAKLLFENALNERIQSLLNLYKGIDEYAKMMSKYMRPRASGRDVLLVKKVEYPPFLIEKGIISVFLYDTLLEGTLSDFSDADGQKIYGKPANLNIKGELKDGRFASFLLDMMWDRTQKDGKDYMDLEVKGLKMDDFKAFTSIAVNTFIFPIISPC